MVERLAGESGVAGDLDQRAFEAADVLRDVLGDEIQDGRRDVELQAGGLAAENGQPGFEVGRLDVGGQTPFEAGDEPGFEFLDFAGAAVAGQHNLLTGLEEVVEGVEELFLDALFAGEELDVVDEQDVDVAVALTELGQAVLLEGLDELIGEFLRRKVGHAGVGVVTQDRVANGVHQVGFAQPGVAIDEKGIVGLRRSLGDRQGGGVGHLVVRADDEGFERVTGIERSRGGAALIVTSGAARGGRPSAVVRLRRDAVGRVVVRGRGGRGVGLAEGDVDQAAGGQPQALGDQVEVIVVNPDRREIVGHPQGHRVLRGIQAHHGLKPHLKHVLREELLEVAFDGFPQAG
jgi:hypothetical protein